MPKSSKLVNILIYAISQNIEIYMQIVSYICILKDMIIISHKVCGCHSVPFLSLTPLFDWLVCGGSYNKHHKDIYIKIASSNFVDCSTGY